jgi:hypothetical protein
MTTDDSVTFYAIHQRFGGGMFTAAEAVREIPSDKLPDVVRGAIVYRDHNGSGDPAKSLGRWLAARAKRTGITDYRPASAGRRNNLQLWELHLAPGFVPAPPDQHPHCPHCGTMLPGWSSGSVVT